MKLRTTIFFFLLFFVAKAYSATKYPTLHWNKGVVVLQDNTVIYGDISYIYEYNLVFIKEDKTIRSYSSSNIESVRYYDARVNINRYFIRLKKGPIDNSLNAKSNILFEVVVSGNIQLLRVPKKYVGKFGKSDFLEDQRNYNYYLFAYESLVNLSDFREIFLPQLLSRNRQLTQQLIDKNKLNMDNQGDCVKLIVLCNEASIASVAELTAL